MTSLKFFTFISDFDHFTKLLELIDARRDTSERVEESDDFVPEIESLFIDDCSNKLELFINENNLLCICTNIRASCHLKRFMKLSPCERQVRFGVGEQDLEGRAEAGRLQLAPQLALLAADAVHDAGDVAEVVAEFGLQL